MHIEGYGCAGASAVSYGLVCYELEAVETPRGEPMCLFSGSLAMSAIAKFGSEEQKQEYLPASARGELAGCFGLSEPQGGSDPSNMLTKAVKDGDHWVINGAKRWIGIANIADYAIIWADTEDGIRGFIVPTSTPGFTATPISIGITPCAPRFSATSTSRTCVFLSHFAFPQPRGSEPSSVPQRSAIRDCLGCHGSLPAAIDVAVKFSKERILFGEPLAATQITQTKLADCFLEFEKGVLLSHHIGKLKDLGSSNHDQISVGKLNNVREAVGIVSHGSLDLGGDGVTADYPIMRHMMNLESVRTYEGTDEVHALVVGRALTGEEAFR